MLTNVCTPTIYQLFLNTTTTTTTVNITILSWAIHKTLCANCISIDTFVLLHCSKSSRTHMRNRETYKIAIHCIMTFNTKHNIKMENYYFSLLLLLFMSMQLLHISLDLENCLSRFYVAFRFMCLCSLFFLFSAWGKNEREKRSKRKRKRKSRLVGAGYEIVAIHIGSCMYNK